MIAPLTPDERAALLRTPMPDLATASLLRRLLEERDRLERETTATRTPCARCGLGVRPREMADGLCVDCLRIERDSAYREARAVTTCARCNLEVRAGQVDGGLCARCLRAELDEVREHGRCECSDDDACRLARERDEAREENARWREAWKRAAHYWRDRCMSALRQRTASSEEQEVNEDA